MLRRLADERRQVATSRDPAPPLSMRPRARTRHPRSLAPAPTPVIVGRRLEPGWPTETSVPATAPQPPVPASSPCPVTAGSRSPTTAVGAPLGAPPPWVGAPPRSGPRHQRAPVWNRRAPVASARHPRRSAVDGRKNTAPGLGRRADRRRPARRRRHRGGRAGRWVVLDRADPRASTPARSPRTARCRRPARSAASGRSATTDVVVRFIDVATERRGGHATRSSVSVSGDRAERWSATGAAGDEVDQVTCDVTAGG